MSKLLNAFNSVAIFIERNGYVLFHVLFCPPQIFWVILPKIVSNWMCFRTFHFG